MLRIALKNVLARKGRLLLSALAVIAGCTFLSGVFVFSDTINAQIDKLFATAYDKTDSYVRSAVKIDSDFGDDIRGTIPDTDIEKVRAVPGVKAADGDVQGTAVVTNAKGDVLGGDGPPQFGSVFQEAESSPWELKEGRAASGPTEVVLDAHTADIGDIKVGDKVTISTTGQPREFSVVGIVTFGGSESTGGPTWALFDLPTAEEFVLDEPGKISSINVVGDGTVTQQELSDRIQQLFPADQVEVLTGKEITEESQSELAKQFNFFTTFLTIFAAIAIIVGTFVIYNVFKISSAQRLRENALMRAIGARSSQVTFAQFVEAAAVGVLGSVLGFIGGVGLATLITSILNSTGNGPGETTLVVEPRSFIITFIVGFVVTLVCATFPAIKAGRVPPLAAMRDVAIDRSARSRKRLVVGLISGVIAALGILLGLTSDAIWLAVGVLGLFLTFIAFGPFVVGRVADVLTKPLGKIRGVTGEIAGRNAARSPERTAITAAALGVGLTLMVAVSVLASSLQGTLRETFGKAFTGEIAIRPKVTNNGILPSSLATDADALPDVQAAGIGFSPFNILKPGEDPDGEFGATVVPDAVAKVFQLDFEAGDYSVLKGDNILISHDFADSEDYKVGSTIDAGFLNGTTTTFTVAGIYRDDFFGNVIADRAAFANSGLPQFDFFIAARPEGGATTAQAVKSLETLAEKYPTAKVQSREQYIDDQVKSLDGIINFIYALLLMSVFIAVLGIVLTLLLAVYERRRELGLMRAIGTTRGQVRGSIRWESIITSLLGVMMGITLGVGIGWIVVTALKDQGLEVFSVSISSLVSFGILSLLFGLAAAWIPSRKAAKAPILEAIATT